MTDADKTPVERIEAEVKRHLDETPPAALEYDDYENGYLHGLNFALDVLTPVTPPPDAPTCGAPIRDRSGRDLGYCCNLTRGHLGRHAEIWRSREDGRRVGFVSEESEPQ